MKSFLSRTFVNGNGNEGFLGEHGYGTIRFKTTEDVEKQARMMFLTGRRVEEPDAKEPSKDEQKKEKEELDRAKKAKVPPPPPKFSARAKLVELALAPAIASSSPRRSCNRIWHRLFGQGLVMPLDQMHSANPPSHPELLAWLARDLADHGYDLRRLVRGLVLSRAYARGSRWEGRRPAPPVALRRGPRAAAHSDAAGDVASPGHRRPGEPPAGLPIRAVREANRGSRGERPLARRRRSRHPAATPRSASSEALLFSNSKKIASELLGGRTGTGWSAAWSTRPATAEVVDLAVRNVLSRPPDDEEIRALSAFLAERTDRPDDARRQLVWILLTDSEFRFNH